MRKKPATLALATALLAATALLSACGEQVSEDELNYRTYGIDCLNSGKYEEAVEAFQNALDCSNNFKDTEIDISFYMAQAQVLDGDTTGAFDTYNTLLSAKEIPEAYLQRGNLSLATGDQAAALSDYNQAVEVGGKDYKLYLSIYNTLTAYDDTADAADFLTRAAELGGKSAEDKYYQGRVAFLSGDYDTAKTYLEAAADKGVNDANFYLGQVYSKLGDSTSAMNYFTIYTQSEDATAEGLIQMGVEEEQAGDYEQAIEILETAQGMTDQPDASLLTTLAAAYEHMLQFDKARETLTTYCEAYPDDEAAARELTFLETR